MNPVRSAVNRRSKALANLEFSRFQTELLAFVKDLRLQGMKADELIAAVATFVPRRF